jgi:hypothetical protein
MQMFKASRHDATYWICSITVFQLRDIACGSRCLTCDWETLSKMARLFTRLNA